MKNTYLFLLIFIGLFNIAKAQTNVSGNQSGTWNLSSSPYQVTGDITISSGQTLTIEAGVEVNFQGHYKITVVGKIITQGTETNPVLFTTDNHTTGWGGILIDHSTQISIFNYTNFEYGIATGNFPDMHGGAVKLNEADAEFHHCLFQNNKAVGSGDDGMGGAVYCINTGSTTQSLTKFIDCKFIDNQSITEGGAIKFTNDGNTEITRCQFIGNDAKYGGGAIMFYSAVGVHLTKCLFYNNNTQYSGGGAIKAMNPDVSLTITNCTFVNNSAPTSEGGAMALDYTNADIINSIVYNNTQQYGDEINIGMSTTVTINYSDIDMPADATGSNNLNNINPQFVNQNSGDLHLQASSPCIDTGFDVGLSYQGNAPDMGCYEYGETNSIFYNENVIKIYPNPASNLVFINGDNNISNFEIYNLSGKLILKNKIVANTINVSKLKKGIYFIKLFKNNNLIFVEKITIN